MPECVRNALKPSTPFSINGCISFSLPGITPPQKPQFVCNLFFATANFSSKAFTVVVTGEEFNGISTNIVIPPDSAALVAVSNPSQSVLPGSFM